MRPDPRDDNAYLSDMLRYAREVTARVRNETFASYLANDDFRLATERRILIIGEAAGKVSQRFRAANDQVPWRAMIAQRNILAHQYGEIIDEKIWRVATEHIPSLIAELEPLVPPGPES